MLRVTSCSVATQGSSARRRWIVGFAVCVDDQQDADAPVFASGERPAEEDEALVCERVHERCVLVDCRLLVDASVCPAGSCFADDGEVAHARAIR